MDKPDISIFIDSPELLLGVCQDVIDKLDVRSLERDLTERELQLKEISRTIEKLEKAGVGVPDELRSLKIDLVADLAVSSESNRLLEDLADGFEELVQDLNKRIGRSNNKDIRKQSQKIRSKEPKTTPGVLRQNIIDALITLGGSGRVQQILGEMEKQLHGRLLPRDLEATSRGDMIWQNSACWERFRMIQDGILKNDSPRGVWELREDYK